MLLLAAFSFLVVLAAGFGLVASREIAHAGRADRDTAARHRFLVAFDARTAAADRVPAELLVQAFETIGARTAAPSRVLWPGARLDADLGLSRADVEDAALLVAARCAAPLPHGRDLDALAREVTTVEGFVRFLAPFVEGVPLARAA